MKRITLVVLLALAMTTACIPNPAPRVAAWLVARAKQPPYADKNYVHPVIPGTALNAWPKTQGNPDCRVIAHPVAPGQPRYTAPYNAVSFLAMMDPGLWFLLCFPPGRGVGVGAYTVPTLKITQAPNSPSMTPAFECVATGPPRAATGVGTCEYVGASRFHSTNITVWNRGYVQVV